MQKNLWGELDVEENIRTPTAILKEQADALSTLTKGILDGRVGIDQGGKGLILEFFIVARAINGYSYELLNVTHDVELYPAYVFTQTNNRGRVECNDEQEFEDYLGEILSSNKVKRIISALIAQSKEAS